MQPGTPVRVSFDRSSCPDRAAPADADAFVGEPGKFDKYFSTNPGEGD